MNAVAYGFRDDITDDELEVLITNGIVFECDEHGVLEEVDGGSLDKAVAEMRGESR